MINVAVAGANGRMGSGNRERNTTLSLFKTDSTDFSGKERN
jgi:dihydrodipicolinate reductase